MRPPEPEDLRSFAGRLVGLLDDLALPYAVCGSLAAMEYSEPRLSIDIDLMVLVDETALRRLAGTVTEWGYYVTPIEVIEQEMIPLGRPFNVIDGASGVKADIYPVQEAGLEGAAMQRRKRRAMDFEAGQDAWCLSPEDVILFKLRHYRMGGEVAQKHPMDVGKMIEVIGQDLDRDYVGRWARKLEVVDLWDQLWENHRSR